MFRKRATYRSFSGNKPRFNRFGRGKSIGGRNSRGEFISPARYVNTATPTVAQTPIAIQHAFTDFAVDARLKSNIVSRGYAKPTPIQDQAIPQILEGRDVVGIAQTGSGKTAAFLVPLIHKMIQNQYEKVLIIVPTRELAVQIQAEFVLFTRGFNMHSLLVMGGASMNMQISALRRNPAVIIGTPGRLKDLILKRYVNLREFNNIVLDEVDRMVDIGFINDIRYIISELPAKRQSLFFSATVSPEINTIIQQFLKYPVTVSVKTKETPQSISQDVIKVSKHEKLHKLQSLLRQEEFKKVLIFGRTKWSVQKLSNALVQNGFLADAIHGNKSQGQRLRALNQFRSNQLKILVATDVVSRGVDIEDVTHVINYDEPSTYTDYIHRIGRTGRADKQGKALTFVE